MTRLRALPPGAVLLDRLAGTDVPVHLVGGAVRDLLLGRRPPELDLLVEGDVAPVAARLGGSVRAHERFGTATVRGEGGTFDLARARRERYARPGALPQVEPASLAEDLRRRDFTVNTGALALTGNDPGRLVTGERMREDLEAGVLRVLHDRSFIDDPTRLVRLVRYAGRLAFGVEERTRALATEAIERGALQTVTGSRIGAELRLLAREPDPLPALAAAHELGLDTALGLDAGPSVLDRARSALALLPPDGRAERLVLAAILTDRASREAPGTVRAALDAWGFDAEDRETILAAASHTSRLADELATARSPSAIAAAARHSSPELVALAGALGPRDAAAEWLDRLRHVRLEITGDDLLAAGVPRGAAIGRGLRAALRGKLDDGLAGREAELREALRGARGSE